MEVRSALKSQYHAALKTLHEAIEKCPDAMWDAPADGPARFWRVGYHTLFFTHFYLQQDQAAFTPWDRHRDEAQYMVSVPGDSQRPPKPCDAFTRDDLREYCRVCDDMIDHCVDTLDLSAPQCGFPWYTMPTLEHQIVNIRHIQHHAAALSSRLRRSAGIEIGWVGGSKRPATSNA
jgi:DinB superfamily